jgi:hypothetical protein
MFCTIVRADRKYFLLTDEQGGITVSDSPTPLLNYWTHGWRRGLERGGTWHASACISFVQCSPSVVEFTNIPDLQARILGEREKYHYERVSGAGIFHGIPCEAVGVEEVWQSGQKPEFY